MLSLPSGEDVLAQEKFFVVRSKNQVLTNNNQTNEERQIITEHKWWHIEDLRTTSEIVYPKDLVDILMTTTITYSPRDYAD